MPERPIDSLVRRLKAARFDVVLGIDHGAFQILVLREWPTILETLEARAKRERTLTLVEGKRDTDR